MSRSPLSNARGPGGWQAVSNKAVAPATATRPRPRFLIASMERGVSIRRPDVSRNALEQNFRAGLSGGLAGLLALASPGFAVPEVPPVSRPEAASKSRVIVVRDTEATEAYEPRPERVSVMVNQ